MTGGRGRSTAAAHNTFESGHRSTSTLNSRAAVATAGTESVSPSTRTLLWSGVSAGEDVGLKGIILVRLLALGWS